MPVTTKNLHQTYLSVSYPYWASTELFYVWLIIFLSMIGFGNSILKIWNGIKFTYIHVSILYAIIAFWLVLYSSLVNMTDFTLWNIKYFILAESKLLFVSSWLGKVTSYCLRVSWMDLVCWGIIHTHACSLELQHTALNWFCFLRSDTSAWSMFTTSIPKLKSSTYLSSVFQLNAGWLIIVLACLGLWYSFDIILLECGLTGRSASLISLTAMLAAWIATGVIAACISSEFTILLLFRFCHFSEPVCFWIFA